MEVDIPIKKAKFSSHDKEIVTFDDEDESTNQNQEILIQEEMSQAISCSERTISQIGFQEEQSKHFLNVQHSTYSQVESCLYQSK